MTENASDCDSFCHFFKEKTPLLRFGRRQGRLRQKIAGDLRLRFLVLPGKMQRNFEELEELGDGFGEKFWGETLIWQNLKGIPPTGMEKM